mmetsp:Transcript_120517/g.346247  ORF Transcript_120517/g.346247 Transcript_120517/m.346247 type:complete len:213 (+) Transcript_120517:516-1154(+)
MQLVESTGRAVADFAPGGPQFNHHHGLRAGPGFATRLPGLARSLRGHHPHLQPGHVEVHPGVGEDCERRGAKVHIDRAHLRIRRVAPGAPPGLALRRVVGEGLAVERGYRVSLRDDALQTGARPCHQGPVVLGPWRRETRRRRPHRQRQEQHHRDPFAPDGDRGRPGARRRAGLEGRRAAHAAPGLGHDPAGPRPLRQDQLAPQLGPVRVLQ